MYSGEASRRISKAVRVTEARRERYSLPNGSAAPGSHPRMFRYKSAGDDYWVCRTWDGTTEGETDIKIAKPPELRKALDATYWPGVTMAYSSATQRTATQGETEETHVLCPALPINAAIYATRVSGGTGVEVDNTPVVWLDLNVAGRAWAVTSG